MARQLIRISRDYSNFKGSDFTNNLANLYRSPDNKNMWKDYSSTLGSSIDSRKGLVKKFNYTGVMYGMYFFEHSDGLQVIVHCGTKLLKWNNFPTANTLEEHVTVLKSSGMSASKSSFFVFNDVLYIKDKLNYLAYDGTNLANVSTLAFVPTTTIGKTAAGGGTVYQYINLLSDYRMNSFIGDGTSTSYQLDAVLLDPKVDYAIEVWINGSLKLEDTHFTVNRTLGKIIPNTPADFSAPLTVGQDNMIVKFKKAVSGYLDRILKCDIIAEFDNRIFFSGNLDYPSILWHSELDSPNYISDISYYTDGYDTSLIKRMVEGNRTLWVLKRDGQDNKTVYSHTPQIDDVYGKVYPTSEASVKIGCYGDAINFGDDIVFMAKTGLKGLMGNLDSEQLVRDRSKLVDPRLANETNLDQCKFIEYAGYLLVLVNGKIYAFDSRERYAYGTDSYEFGYEAYYWDNVGVYETTTFYPATMMKVYNGVLYLGTTNGFICTLTGTNDDGKLIDSYWCTIHDNMGYPNKLKTTNKKGGVARVKSITGQMKVAIRKDRGTWKTIGTYDTTSTTDYVVYKPRMKKATEVQLKFYTDTIDKPFGLYSATLDGYVGSYVKKGS